MGDSTLTPDPSAPRVRTDLARVLVTGVSGFVGTNLVTELLDRGHELRSFDRASSPLPSRTSAASPAMVATTIATIGVWPRSLARPSSDTTVRPSDHGSVEGAA